MKYELCAQYLGDKQGNLKTGSFQLEVPPKSRFHKLIMAFGKIPCLLWNQSIEETRFYPVEAYGILYKDMDCLLTYPSEYQFFDSISFEDSGNILVYTLFLKNSL